MFKFMVPPGKSRDKAEAALPLLSKARINVTAAIKAINIKTSLRIIPPGGHFYGIPIVSLYIKLEKGDRHHFKGTADQGG
jgi:hypothetical protein